MTFPEDIVKREQYILDAVTAGDFEAKWTTIEHVEAGHRVKLQVMEDALKIQGVRVNVSATLSQKLADLFGASLPTAKVADLMFALAVRKATPCPMPISTSTTSMMLHSQAVDKQIGSSAGLTATVGKHWVLDKQIESKPDKACNYGWHFTGPSFQGIKGSSSVFLPNVRVIQPNATAHDARHTDYSQICQLVNQTCWIDDNETLFSSLIKSSLASIVSHQGPLSIDRQPRVPLSSGQVVLFPVVITP